MQCKNSLERLTSCRNNLDFLAENSSNEENREHHALLEELETYKKDFLCALEDDFNTADAIAALFNLTRKINIIVSEGKELSKAFLQNAMKIFDELCEILGFCFAKNKEKLDDDVKKLIIEREEARKNKDWKLSDSLREKIERMGVKLEDTKDGVKWSKV